MLGLVVVNVIQIEVQVFVVTVFTELFLEDLYNVFVFQVDKVVEQLMQFIHLYDLNSLKELWTHLDQRMFSKLENNFTPGMYYCVSVTLFLLYMLYRTRFHTEILPYSWSD